MTDLLGRLAERDRKRLETAPHPEWCAPVLARLTDEPFSDRDWLFERKLDGERVLAYRRRRRVRLLSRNRKSLNRSYPELVEALAEQACDDFVVDGEVVAFDGRRSSFARLQRRMQLSDPAAARASGVKIQYYLFDLLYLDGKDLRRLPLRRRKTLLRDAIGFEDPLRFTPHRNETGEEFLREACAKGWEGLIAKRANAPYRGRAVVGLAEVQMRRRPGARDRRLQRAARQPQGLWRPAARLLRRSRACAMRARSAPASTIARWSTCAVDSTAWSAAARPSPIRSAIRR